MSKLGYIDALRGYAILLVIAVHTSQCVPGLEWPLRPLADQGARGVQLFFVVSALTLCMSWFRRCDGAPPFYARRLFRIAPMFWLAIVFFVTLDGFGRRYWAPGGIGWPHVFATFAFVHGFHPETINSVVPGGSTIATEMTFYAFFPALVAVVKSWWSAMLAVVCSLVFAEWIFPHVPSGLAVLMPGEDHGLLANFATLWFPNQLPVFLVGILVFHLLRETPAIPKAVTGFGLLASAFVMVGLPFITLRLQIQFAYAIAFGLATFCLGRFAPATIVNAPVKWMGKISFSAYLWHFAILGVINKFIIAGQNPLRISDPTLGWKYFLALYVGLAAATAALATLTYLFVETPMIRLGEKLVTRWFAHKSPPINISTPMAATSLKP